METDTIDGRGVRVRAYFGERDKHRGKPLWSALLEFLRREAHSVIHAASIVDLSSDLPLVLEWIDTEERVNRLLPAIEAMLQGGLITTDSVTIIRYEPHTERDRSSPPGSSS